MSFDWFNWLNCMIEFTIMLVLWRLIDTRPFHWGNYAFTYVLLGLLGVPITLVDSVSVAILPINYALVMLCVWLGFRRDFKETLLHSLFFYLLLLYLESVGCCIVPERMFLTNAGNFIVTTGVLLVAVILLIVGRRFRFHAIFERHAATMWTFVLVLCVPEIALVQLLAAQKHSPSSPVNVILLLLQFLYMVTVILWFSVVRQRNERRQLANTEKYIHEMNSHLEESRRSMHDFNKHIRYVRNTVAVESTDRELVRHINEYCESMLDIYEKEELLLQLDDPVLRAILYGRQSQAIENRIRYILDATPILPKFPLKNYQIVEVFDNLMDNAFECVADLPENARWIRITLSATPQSNGAVEQVLCIENPAPHADMAAISSGKRYTSKGGAHQGIGLRHVSRLVSATDGNLRIGHANGVFKAKVVYVTPPDAL